MSDVVNKKSRNNNQTTSGIFNNDSFTTTTTNSNKTANAKCINVIRKSNKKSRNNNFSFNSYMNMSIRLTKLITVNTNNKLNIKDKRLYKRIKQISFEDKEGNYAKYIKTYNSKSNEKIIKGIHNYSKHIFNGNSNSDSFFIFKNFLQSHNNYFIGLCNCNGDNGVLISNHIRENLPYDLNHAMSNKTLSPKEIRKYIMQSYAKENLLLLRNKKINSNLSGCCLLGLIYFPSKIVISQLSDSKAIIARYSNEWSWESLVEQHNIHNKGEIERIKKNYDVTNYKGNITRAFCNYELSFKGLSSIPEIKEYHFTKEDKFIVIGSRGMWRYVNEEEVVNIVKKFYVMNDIVTACEEVYKYTKNKWVVNKGNMTEDFTVIILFFE